jgi:hypothetical protein
MSFLDKIVDKTIVLNFGGQFIDVENITVIPVLENFESFKTKNFASMILNYLGRKNLKSEDIFIFSKTFEIPTPQDIKNYIKSKEVGPTIMNQNVYYYNISLLSIYKKMGTAISTYTGLVTQNDPQNMIVNNRSKFTYNKEELFSGGFSILGFEDKELSLESLKYWYPEDFSNLSDDLFEGYINREECPNNNLKPHILKNVDSSSLSKFFKKNQSRLNIKKILLTFFYEKFEQNVYDDIFYLTDNNIELDGVVTKRIEKPKKIYYKTNNYYLDFKINEVSKVLRDLNVHDEDEVHLKIKTVGDSTVFKYKDIKNNILSDIIGTSSFFPSSL